MGNCDQKAFVDDSIAQRQFSPSGDTPTTDTMEKDPNEELDNMMSRPFAFKKEKSAVDPLCTYIRNAIPKAILSIETASSYNSFFCFSNCFFISETSPFFLVIASCNFFILRIKFLYFLALWQHITLSAVRQCVLTALHSRRYLPIQALSARIPVTVY